MILNSSRHTRNPSDHTGLWCYTESGWKDCDPGDGSVVPFCDTHLEAVTRRDVATIAHFFDLASDSITADMDRGVLDDTSFDKHWVDTYKMYMLLTNPEISQTHQLLEELLLHGSAEQVLQSVFSLIHATQSFDFKSQDIAENFASVAKSVFGSIQKEAGLTSNAIFQAVVFKTKNIEEEYDKMFGEEEDIFHQCLKTPDTCSDSSHKILEVIPNIDLISQHPVHILGPDGVFNPTAFIPFCKVGSEVLGDTIANFSQPVCNVFKPKQFEGQLCFTIDLENIYPRPEFGNGPSKGLSLLLDLNEERAIGSSSNAERQGETNSESSLKCK